MDKTPNWTPAMRMMLWRAEEIAKESGDKYIRLAHIEQAMNGFVSHDYRRLSHCELSNTVKTLNQV